MEELEGGKNRGGGEGGGKNRGRRGEGGGGRGEEQREGGGGRTEGGRNGQLKEGGGKNRGREEGAVEGGGGREQREQRDKWGEINICVRTHSPITEAKPMAGSPDLVQGHLTLCRDPPATNSIRIASFGGV